ncbi:MAG: HutD family protein [Undibacterium sp.]|nr:HutD family protein [Undibacterium sp.]
MRHWTIKDYRSMPWKNGGGSTTELAIYPDGTSLDDFVWRLSTAQVASAGAFSHFPQIDRSLAILDGDGLVLKTDLGVPSESVITLGKSSLPHRFSGEDAIYAELCGGVVLDLNLMTRRGVCLQHMQRLDAGEHCVYLEDAQQVLLYCAEGTAALSGLLGRASLQTGDLLLLEEEHEDKGIQCQIQAGENSVLYLMRISFLSRS